MWLVSIIVLILMLGILVLLHEFGHFIVARLCGVHVYEFSVGMGPLLCKHISKKSGIQYSLRALPIGGYVQLAGEVMEDDDKIPKAKRGVPFGMHRFEDEGDGYHYVEETYNYNNYNDFNNFS